MSENPFQSTAEPPELPRSPSVGSRKPAAIPVFGVLNIVFALFGLGGTVVNAVILFGNILPDNPQFRNPVLDLLDNNPAYRIFIIVTMGLGVVFGLVQLFAGINLMRNQRSGRSLSLIYGWYAIIMGITGTIANYFFLLKPMLDQMDPNGNPAAIGGAVGGALGGCAGLIYPVLLLIFMNRRNVIDWLDHES